MSNKNRNKYWPYWALVLFIAMAAVWHANAKAETAIWAGAWSKHLITNDDYTSSHDLVAAEHKSVLAARYRNSYGRESYAIGYGANTSYGDLRLSGYIGATTGYTKCWGNDDSSGNVCPMFVGAAHYTRYSVQPGLLLFGEALALTVRFEL